MTIFLDLWQDLREKRLWPVAAGLVVALIATPIVLFKPASSTPDTPLPTARAPEGVQLPVVSVSSGPGAGSKLQSFQARDPFKPLDQLSTTSKSTSATSSSGGSTTGSSSPGGSTIQAAGAGATSSAPSGGSAPLAGGSSGAGSGSPTPAPTANHVAYYRWIAHVRFGAPGKEQSTKLEEGQVLPSKKDPVVMFLGVDASSNKALFLVLSSNVYAYGKGECSPTTGPCSVIWLSPNGSSSESFAEYKGGSQWDLKLTSVGTELVPAKSVPGSSSSKPLTGASADQQAAALAQLLTLSDLVGQSG